MDRESIFGLALIALFLGGLLLLARRPASNLIPIQENPARQSSVKIIPIQEEPQRYHNKETRNIEYNEDGLPVKIEIIRDYAIT